MSLVENEDHYYCHERFTRSDYRKLRRVFCLCHVEGTPGPGVGVAHSTFATRTDKRRMGGSYSGIGRSARPNGKYSSHADLLL